MLIGNGATIAGWACTLPAWASNQICKIAGCVCARNAGSIFPVTVGKRSRHASQHVRDACAMMHAGIANKWFPLKLVVGKTFPAFLEHTKPSFTYLVRGPWPNLTSILYDCWKVIECHHNIKVELLQQLNVRYIQGVYNPTPKASKSFSWCHHSVAQNTTTLHLSSSICTGSP